MLSKKLTSLLDTFSKYERNQFRKYLISPFFNENENLVTLFDQINKHQENDTLSKMVVWKKIFGNEKFDDATIRRLCSMLTRMAYQFLLLKQSKTSPVQEQTQLLEILNQRKLDKHFQSLVKNTKAIQSKNSSRNAEFHYQNFLIERYCHLNYEKTVTKIDNFDALKLSDFHLDCFYIIQKLKHYCDTLGYRLFLAAEVELDLMPSFLDYIKHHNYLQEPSIQAYYLVTQMLMQPEEETYFHQLKQLLIEQTELFSNQDLNTLFIHLNNYCILEKINVGKSEYFLELFDNFKIQLETKIIFKNEELAPQDYKNIITVGLHIKAFDWVEQFIQQYTEKLPPKHQENALTYNLAQVYFAQKKYNKVIEQLRDVEYRNLSYALGGKLRLLKTYYELKEFLALDSLMDSFRIYLRRNKMISKEEKQKYLNVLRFVKKLSNLKANDVQGIEKVKQQINACQALADKQWILEKMNELEPKQMA